MAQHPLSANTHDQRFFRLADGRPARISVVDDDDRESSNPRTNQDNPGRLFTWESDNVSPDDNQPIPPELYGAITRWTGGDTYPPLSGVYLIQRYAAMFHADEVLHVAALARNWDGLLRIVSADDIDLDREYDGIAVVTRSTWEDCMGDRNIDTRGAEAVARADLHEYNLWATGEVYGYVTEVPAFPGANIDHDCEVLDSNWGVLAHQNIPTIMNDAIGELEDGWTEITKDEFDEVVRRAQSNMRRFAKTQEYEWPAAA